ncbi:MAG TPA: outer membrane beta-barrel protein [Candidatus Sulfotelmatobacter sp.]
MRKFMVLACVLSLFAVSAMAAETGSYPKAEFFGGYQYTHSSVNGSGYGTNGFDFALNGNFNNYFGITADFGAGYTTQSGVSLHNYTYTFGPQLSLRANKAYTPFVHALIGGDRATASVGGISASGNGWATMIGGGADFNFSQHMAFRGGADWFLLHNNGVSQNKNVRMVTGIVFKY